MRKAIPEFSIKKEIRGHVINDVLRKIKCIPIARKHAFLQGIPESSNSIIFLKDPPSFEN